MLRNVTYDRSQRVYEIFGRNGDTVVTVPAVKSKGKKAALQFAVLVENFELHQIVVGWVRDYPALASRAWRAAELVINGDVLPPFESQWVATVVSQSNPYGDYNLRLVDGALHCECEDFLSFAAPMIGASMQPLCKHACAVLFSQQLGLID